MWRYIGKRILMMIPVLLGVSLLIFVLLYIAPGDPAALVLGEDATVEAKDAWREKYGLNDPFIVQYLKYIGKILFKGDFGNSYRTGKSVTDAIKERFPTTFMMATCVSIVSTIFGLILGITAANHQNTWIDTIVRIIGMLGISIPHFWFALLLIMLFAVKLNWLPVSGLYGPEYWVLPAFTMGFGGSASLMRITRSSMLDNIRQDFIKTARAKGQTERVITRHHVLRNALIPIVTSIGGHFAVALGGAMILEQVFAIPGLGKLMVDAINNRDHPQVRGSVVLLATSTSIINLLIDIMYAYIDPRIKSQFASGSKKKLKEIKSNESKEAAA